MEGVRTFREQRGQDTVDLWVLSAGYGLIQGDREIVPYECTFSGMRAKEVDEWAQHLRIPDDAREVFAESADWSKVSRSIWRQSNTAEAARQEPQRPAL